MSMSTTCQSISVLRAALHYDDSDEPFYDQMSAKDHAPKCGAGHSKFQATETLIKRGMVVRTKNMNGKITYTATEGLRMYIDALRKIDLPSQKWVQPE